MAEQQKGHITPAGFQRLSNEYNDLRHRQRPKIVEEVSQAAAMGDRSENAEYIYGKKKLREIDSRLGYLAKRMANVQIVDPVGLKNNRVAFGATVNLEYEDGKIVTWRIVGEDEVDVANNKISYKSPVGRSLLGHKVDDVLTIHRPIGAVEVTILALSYEAIE